MVDPTLEVSLEEIYGIKVNDATDIHHINITVGDYVVISIESVYNTLPSIQRLFGATMLRADLHSIFHITSIFGNSLLIDEDSNAWTVAGAVEKLDLTDPRVLKYLYPI